MKSKDLHGPIFFCLVVFFLCFALSKNDESLRWLWPAGYLFFGVFLILLSRIVQYWMGVSMLIVGVGQLVVAVGLMTSRYDIKSIVLFVDWTFGPLALVPALIALYKVFTNPITRQ